jgi:hypothetical protein
MSENLSTTEMNTGRFGSRNPSPKPIMARTGQKPRGKKTATPKPRKNQWTTLEQMAWLTEHTHEYHDIQADPDRNFTAFWSQLFESWFEKWPVPNPTPEQIASGQDKKEQVDAVKAVSSQANLHDMR